MNIKQGLEILLDMEKKHKEGIIRPETKIVAACELGGNEIIKYRKVKNLINDKELENKIPAVIIIPGNLHFMEKEFLKNNQ
jgi:diphthamide biosynthesis methyltransferase